MRRRRGAGAVPAGACGVWLDTAQLKRGPARPPRLRAPSRVPERKQSPVLLPQPGTRQTTIPTFFCPPSDEGDKENSRPAPCSPAGACGGSGAPLPAWPVKILALPQLEGAQEEPPGAEQGLQGTAQAWKTPLDALELQGECQRQSKASRGAGQDSWCCSCSQSPDKSRLFPGETASGGRKAQPWSRAAAGPGSAGAEDTNPAPGAAPRGVCCAPRGVCCAPRGVCCSPQSPGRAQPLRERGQVPAGSCRQLFCQDSQGNRVIAHGPRASQLELELGSEPLFTQDSEGNRVIKHW